MGGGGGGRWAGNALFLILGALHCYWSFMNILYCGYVAMWLQQGIGWAVIRRSNVILVQQLSVLWFEGCTNCSSSIIDLQNYVHPLETGLTSSLRNSTMQKFCYHLKSYYFIHFVWIWMLVRFWKYWASIGLTPTLFFIIYCKYFQLNIILDITNSWQNCILNFPSW